MKKLALAALSVLLALAAWMLRVDEPALVGGAAPAESARLVDDVALKPVEEPAADRVSPPSSKPPPEPDSARTSLAGRFAFGALDVRIATADGTGRVLLRRPEEKKPYRSFATDASGRGAIERLRAGAYVVDVDGESLPAGLLPPWGQGRRQYGEPVPGFFSTEVEVQAGERVAVLLRVFPESRAWGYVFGPRGEPVAHAFVRYQSLVPERVAIAPTVETDADGLYEITTGLYPGPYRLNVFFDLYRKYPEALPGRRYDQLALPPLPDVEVAAGGSQRVDLRLEQGPLTLVGEVVDQDGRPVAGLHVKSWYGRDPKLPPDGHRFTNQSDRVASGRTDAEGRYVLEGVHAEQVVVFVGSGGYSPSRPVGENRLAFHPGVIHCDLRGKTGVVELPPRTALLSRPFFLDGRVELDAWGAAPRKLELSELRLVCEYEVVRRGQRHARSDRLEIAEDGAFEWACETPQDPVVLRLSALGLEDAVELEVAPVPADRLSGIRLVFPPEHGAGARGSGGGSDR